MVQKYNYLRSSALLLILLFITSFSSSQIDIKPGDKVVSSDEMKKRNMELLILPNTADIVLNLVTIEKEIGNVSDEIPKKDNEKFINNKSIAQPAMLLDLIKEKNCISYCNYINYCITTK